MNAYQILKISPQATEKEIKEARDHLLLVEKNHPDLGGNPKTAALILEAFETLIQPRLRLIHDTLLLKADHPLKLISTPKQQRKLHRQQGNFLPIEIIQAGKNYFGVLLDFSISGMRLETTQYFYKDDTLTIQCEAFSVQGKVLWIKEKLKTGVYQVGLTLTEFEAKTKSIVVDDAV